MSKPGSINSAYINTGWIQIKILPIAMTKLQDNLVVILTFPCNEIHVRLYA